MRNEGTRVREDRQIDRFIGSKKARMKGDRLIRMGKKQEDENEEEREWRFN